MAGDNGRGALSDGAAVTVTMTARQARLAIRALRHVGREIHDQDDDGMVLIALSEEIEAKLNTGHATKRNRP